MAGAPRAKAIGLEGELREKRGFSSRGAGKSLKDCCGSDRVPRVVLKARSGCRVSSGLQGRAADGGITDLLR